MSAKHYRIFGYLFMAALLLFWVQPVLAQTDLLPFDPSLYPGFRGEDNGLVETAGGSIGVRNTVFNIYNAAKTLLAPVIVVLIGSFGIRMIIAGGNEEKFGAVTQNFLYVLMGVGIVFLADFLSQTFFLYSGDTGQGFLTDNEQLALAADRVTEQIRIIVLFLRYLLGGIALFYVVRSGAVILFSAEEETVDKEKDTFIYGFVGLILIMVSEALVGAVFNVPSLENISAFGPIGEVIARPSVDVEGGLGLIANVTNLLLAMLSGLFLFTLVAGGVMYAFSAGNEERGQQAYKMIIGSLLGLVIAFSSYTIVAEFSSGGRAINRVQIETAPISPQSLPNTFTN